MEKLISRFLSIEIQKRSGFGLTLALICCIGNTFAQAIDAKGDAVAASGPRPIVVTCETADDITISADGSDTANNYSIPTSPITCTPSGAFTGAGAWTGAIAAGQLNYLFSQPIISATIMYTAVNGVDEATISINGTGTMTLSNLCGMSATTLTSQSAYLDCTFAVNHFGDVRVTVTSSAPFTQINLVNSGGNSGWVQGDICHFEVDLGCPITLSLASALDDVTTTTGNDREAMQTIYATNQIFTGGAAVYHANNFVEMNPGFEAEAGSQFKAYIADCGSGFSYRPGHMIENVSGNKAEKGSAGNNVLFAQNQLKIYPNPSATTITVEYRSNLKSITILSIDGKTMFKKDISGSLYDIDVSGFANGIYLIATETSDGKIIQTKFVKN